MWECSVAVGWAVACCVLVCVPFDPPTHTCSLLSLYAFMIKFLCHAECNKPSNMMIWGIAPGTFRDEVTHDNCVDTCAERHAR